MDFNGDGEIGWTEFHSFISYEAQSGQNLLGGELVLPSGLCLPLGQMIDKLQRSTVLGKVFEASISHAICMDALKHSNGRS
jgi:hypothetical protein